MPSVGLRNAMPFAHLTLATRDVQCSQAFFVETMRWRPIQRPGNVDRPVAWLEIAPGQELHLIEVAEFTPTPHEREFGRHVAFALPVAEFEGLKQRLRGHGAELIEPIRETPFARFFFRDPNGYIFEIVAAEHESET